MYGKRYILLNVNIINGKGNEPLYNYAVVVSDGKIVDVLPTDKAKEIKGYEKYEMNGYFLLPGLIDAHVHLAGCKGDELASILINPTVRAFKGLGQAQQLLRYGFTSVRDISWNGLYLKRIFNEGSIIGPRIIACGPGLNRRGGHSDIHELPIEYIEDKHFWGVFADGKEEIKKAIRLIIREGADQIKFWATGGDNNCVDRAYDSHYNFEEIKTIVEEAKMIRGTKVCAHAEELEAIKNCVAAGVDSIEHGEDLDDEVADEMIKKNIYLVPTLKLLVDWEEDFATDEESCYTTTKLGPFFYRDKYVEKPIIQYEREKVISSFKLAYEKGVKIALGSDSVDEDVTNYGKYSALELKTMVDVGGMTPIKGIKSACQTAAEILGISNYIGTIEKGKIADMILIKGDPSSNIDLLVDKRNIHYVIKEGKLVVEHDKLILP